MDTLLQLDRQLESAKVMYKKMKTNAHLSIHIGSHISPKVLVRRVCVHDEIGRLMWSLDIVQVSVDQSSRESGRYLRLLEPRSL